MNNIIYTINHNLMKLTIYQKIQENKLINKMNKSLI